MSQAEFACKDQTVPPEWIDYSGHMNIGYYLLAFERAAVDLFGHLDLSGAYRARTDHAQFALETHINFMAEVHGGDVLRMTGQLLGYDEKRTRAFFRMHHAKDGRLAATNEVMYLHVDLKRRRAAPYGEATVKHLEAMWASHRHLPWPPQAGRGIGFPAKKDDEALSAPRASSP